MRNSRWGAAAVTLTFSLPVSPVCASAGPAATAARPAFYSRGGLVPDACDFLPLQRHIGNQAMLI